MNTSQPSSDSVTAAQAETACGARVMITPHAHFIDYQEETIYFCAEDCKQLYDDDPLISCMAARLLSGK
jgi:YHS domain-containing protein